MSEFKRQHPAAAIARAFELVRGNLITILILLVFGAGGSEGPSFLWMFFGLFLFLLLAGIAGWWRFLYRVEDGQLHIRQGILVQKNIYLNRERVQVIDVTAGVVQRLFGLVRVEFKTAGATSREASLNAISREEADELTHLLKKEIPKDFQKDDSTEDRRVPEAPTEFRPGSRLLLIAASTSGSFGIALSVIATIFSQIEPLLSDSEFYEAFISLLPGQANVMVVLSFLGVLAVFAWLMSFFGTLFQYGNFVLTMEENELTVRRGILEKKHITVPYNRIQAVRVVEGMLRQPFGYASVLVESAGYGDQQEAGSVVIFPLIKREELHEFIQTVLPEWHTALAPVHPPTRAVTRYIIRSSIILAGILGLLYVLLEMPPWIWVWMLPGIYWGWLRHRDAAAGADRDRVVIRFRNLARTTAIIQRNRAQDITCRSTWFQNRRKLAHVELAVASGDQGRTFRISDLERASAEKLFSWLSSESGSLPDKAIGGEGSFPEWGSAS